MRAIGLPRLVAGPAASPERGHHLARVGRLAGAHAPFLMQGAILLSIIVVSTLILILKSSTAISHIVDLVYRARWIVVVTTLATSHTASRASLPKHTVNPSERSSSAACVVR